MTRLVLLLVLVAVKVGADDYLDEMQGRCDATRKTYFCTKYKIFKYIDDYHLGNVSLTSDSSVQLVQLPNFSASNSTFSEKSREYVARDSEVTKIVKFFKRRISKVLQEQGVSLELPEGSQVITEDVAEARGVLGKGKKEKKLIIIPILMLLKLFKIKVLASLILVGVVVIKKMLLTAAFILPGVVAAIKHHCKAQQLHVVPYHAEEDHYAHSHEHEHDENGYSAGYGSYGFGGGYGVDHWDKKKRFSY